MTSLSLTFFKPCTKCGCTKPCTTEFFHRGGNAKHGFQSACKVCKRLIARKYEARRDYSNRDKEAHARAVRKWYSKNRDKKLAQTRERYLANKEEFNRRRNQRYAANKEREAAYGRRRRALKLAAPGSHTLEEVMALLEEQGRRCFYCGVDLEDGYHVEHMTPLSRGGADSIDNIVIACETCNKRKGTKTAEEFLQT